MYAITTRGRAALAQRLAEPATFPRIKNEAHLRLLAGDMIDDATILESFRAMRPELDRLDALIDQMLAQADDFPHRARYLRLNHTYAKQLVAVHRAWVDNVERALSPTSPSGDGPPPER
jgi:hypothetical protein